MSDTGRKYKISQFCTLCKCVAANSFYSAAKSYVPQIRALAERIFSNRCYIISKITSVISLFPLKAFLSIVVTL